MSYTLSIGEFTVESYPEDRYVHGTVQEPSESVIAESPVTSMFDGRRSNKISTGYSQWFNFIWSVGLLDVFKGDTDDVSKEDWEFQADAPMGINYESYWFHEGDRKQPILDCHPGIVALDEDYLERFRAARDYWREHPAREESMAENEDDVDINGRRLRWLCWWVEWAVEDCEYPSFANT